MGLRTDLQAIFEALIGGSGKVYFQVPPSIKMIYPCIIYEHSGGNTRFANNKPYMYEDQYTVTLIDPNPDSAIRFAIINLPKCVYERHYTVDNLNHDIFRLYY